MEVGLNYARIVVYTKLIDYIRQNGIINDKHVVFSIDIIDSILEKVKEYVMENEEVDLKFIDTYTECDKKIIETINKYFHIDDSYMIINTKDLSVLETFVYLYRIKAAMNSEINDCLYFTSIVDEIFSNNPSLADKCVESNEQYIDIATRELLYYYRQYSKVCRDAYNSGKNVQSMRPVLKEIAEAKKPLLEILCIDDKFFKDIINIGKSSHMFINEDFYITKLKKDVIEYRIMHHSIYNSPNETTADDLILYFNTIINSHYYANMIQLIDSGVLDDFPREKNYIMTQVSLEDAICENIFLGSNQNITLSKEKKEKCKKFPKTMLYELYKVAIDNNVLSVMQTTDTEYVNNSNALASNICSILFLKAIASVDPRLEDEISNLIRNSGYYNSDKNRTSSILIQNFMNLEYVCQSEIEKIKGKRKDNN